ncbi:MAG TPA: nucleotide exchange factor GrpE [Actinomycetota bacterium]|nr:nucleotide exchange factor GrpE [Actinomycetota bacterium]
MERQQQQGPRKIKVHVKDKRRVAPDGQPSERDGAAPEAAPVGVAEPEPVETEGDGGSPVDGAVSAVEAESPAPVEEPDYLGDLQRLQAEFANYRKRMMRESAEASARGGERLVVQLLPVLDNFERAIAHGEGGEGVELVFKELKAVLETAGLEEVPGEGAPFDPQVHEAVESREDESVTDEVVRAVHRRGYTMNGKLLRAAMVGVARPPAPPPAPEEEVQEEEGQE